LDCVAIHPRLELCLRTDLVERAHERGLLIEPWTITTTAQADRLRSVGVDGLISDICAPLAR
jgi:glycerophosphoryl diester phosphodiesterase